MKVLGVASALIIGLLIIATDIFNISNINYELIIYILIYGFYIVSIYYLIYVFFKYDKEYSVDLITDNIPIDYKPFQIEYLLKNKISKYSLAAVVIDLIRREALLVKEVKIKSGLEYIIYDNVYFNNDELSKTEKTVKDLFIKKIGNGELFTLGSLSSLLRSRKQTIYFLNSFMLFKEVAEMECFSKSIFETKPSSVKNRSIWLFVFGIVISFLTFKYKINFYPGKYLFVFSILIMTYITKFKKKTKQTNEDYQKWTLFERKLDSFNSSKLLDTYNDLLEQYLVYGIVFNKANMIEKHINTKNSKTTFGELSHNKFVTNLVYQIVKLVNISKISKVFPTELYGIGKAHNDPEVIKEIQEISKNKKI